MCRVHGGSTKQVKAAARRRLQRQQLEGDLGKLLGDLESDAGEAHPVEALLDALRRTWAMTNVLGSMVGGLGTDALYGPDHLGDARPHVLTEMYAQWLDRAARASKLALDAGVDERRVRIAEDQARVIVDTFRAVFADAELGLTPEQRKAAATVAARHLRAIEGGAS